MAEYKLTASGVVIRAADGASIPQVQGNADYADYLAWLDGGNAPDHAPSPTLAEALAELAAAYKADLAALSAAWLSASVLGGATEAAKKAGVSSALAERKTQYLADIAATRAAHS